MGRQEAVFLKGEADAWFKRNFGKQHKQEVLKCLQALKLKPKLALEIGCGAGHSIAEIQYNLGCEAEGMDPSGDAIAFANQLYIDVDFYIGTMTDKPPGAPYDLIIYGFCLYVCDPDSLAEVVSIADWALDDGGHLVIHDFDPEYPHKVPYHHVAGLYSYKMDYSKLWLSNPAYSLVHKEVIGDGTAVWVLKRDIAAGWPEEAAP